MLLWKKESTRDNACYVDILPSNQVNPSKFEQFKSESKNVQKNEAISVECRKQGNEVLKEGNWTQAIWSYNNCIRSAINGSKQLALGYANRSACFLHLKMYDKCLADIELAKNSNYPQHLMHKLNDRKATCLKEMNGSAGLVEKVKAELSFSSNTKFPGIADVLEVRSNDEFGKHVVASSDIDVGKIVLLEDAFTFVGIDVTKICCKTCAKQNMNFIPCPNCPIVMFCNANCLESNDLHREFCGAVYNCAGDLNVESILTGVSVFPNAESLMKFVECALATRDLDSPECESDSQLKYRLFLKLFASPQDINVIRKDIFDGHPTHRSLLSLSATEALFDALDLATYLHIKCE